MILLGLEDAWLDMQLFSFELIPDVPSDLDRYNYIIDELPAFDIIMSGNTWVQEIFWSCPYEVFDPEQESKVDIHATQIRTWLNNWGDIKISKYLSPEILTFILNNT